MNIFVDENIPYLAEALRKCGNVSEFAGRKLTNKQLKANNCRALITRSTTKINEELLQNTQVEFIGTATSGTDHVDEDYLALNFIDFASAPGANANSVAEYVVYVAIKWAKRENIELNEKKIGVIGFGNIGSIVAEYFDRMGLKVLINDPPLEELSTEFPKKFQYAELDELLSECDIITNHVPLTKDGNHKTYKLLNADNMNNIKDGSLFIHASRGGVVDEAKLIELIDNHNVTAAVDVWESEPLFNIELAGKAMQISPHVGGYSRDGKLRGVAMMAKAFEIYSGCRPDLSKINRELKEYKPLGKKKFKKYDLLIDLLIENRDFDYDDKSMRELLEQPEKERARRFDELRKYYPQRRESL